MDETGMFHCERCGREAGFPMLDCPERQFGSCIYSLQRNRLNSSGGYILLIVGIASAFLDLGILVFLLSGLMPPLNVISWLAMASIMLIISAIILAIGAYSAIGEQITLYNVETGQMWQRRSLGRLKIRQLVINTPEPLPLDAYLRWSLSWPTSLSALLADAPPLAGFDIPADKTGVSALISAIARNPAVYLFEVALLGLVADQRIRLCRGEVQRSYFGRSPKPMVEYLVIPGEVSWQGAEGWLEQRILYAVTRWSQNKEARDWPQGTPISALAHAIYTHDQTSPGGWLLRQVQEDAAKRGLGTLQGTLRRHFEPNPDLAAQVAGEARSVRVVYTQLGRVFPEFIRELDSKVRKGIASRQESSG
jgi:hypothetical protein